MFRTVTKTSCSDHALLFRSGSCQKNYTKKYNKYVWNYTCFEHTFILIGHAILQKIFRPCQTLSYIMTMQKRITLNITIKVNKSGTDPGFQVRGGAHLKKLRRAEGGAKIVGVFRVKNHDFTPKNLIFPILGGSREIFGVFHVKNHDFTPKKNLIFTNFSWGARRVRPPPLNPPLFYIQHLK